MSHSFSLVPYFWVLMAIFITVVPLHSDVDMGDRLVASIGFIILSYLSEIVWRLRPNK